MTRQDALGVLEETVLNVLGQTNACRQSEVFEVAGGLVNVLASPALRPVWDALWVKEAADGGQGVGGVEQAVVPPAAADGEGDPEALALTPSELSDGEGSAAKRKPRG